MMSYLFAAALSLLLFSGGLSSILGNPPKWFTRDIQRFTGFMTLIFAAVLLVKARYELAVPVLIVSVILMGWLDKLKPYFHGSKPVGGENPQAHANTGRALSDSISEKEAHEILGTRLGASEQEIRTAHKTLIMRIHPDSGGNAWLAARVNGARDILLQKFHDKTP